MKQAEESIASQNQPQSAPAESHQQKPSLKESGKKAEIPAIYVVYGSTALIETHGEAKFDQSLGTALEYVANTTGNIFRRDSEYYILISGRWFKGATLEGPWTFVSTPEMPADYTNIPKDSPKSAVLASVAGTPEGKEALIANAIPQTATITRTEVIINTSWPSNPGALPLQGSVQSHSCSSRGNWRDSEPGMRVGLAEG
jgi:hypothetical protein